MSRAFDEAWGFAEQVVKAGEVRPDQTEQQPAEQATEDEQAQPSGDGGEFDQTVLDRKIKRHDEELTIKEFLSKYPDEANEIIQKGYDYQKSKLEVKEELVSRMAEIKQKEEGLDKILLTNLAYEMEIPDKTEEDYLNDLAYDSDDDAREAYKEYRAMRAEKYKVYSAHKEYANIENEKMVKSFTEAYKDVKLDDVMKEVQGYLNASVGKGLIPFPKDTLKVFWTGKNHDKIVAEKVKEARADERKQVYLELEGKVSPTVTNTAQQRGDTQRASAGGFKTPMERQFDEAFGF